MLRTFAYLPLAAALFLDSVLAGEAPQGPYGLQVAANVAKLRSEVAAVRAGAAEALGFLRAYSAEPMLLEQLGDPEVEVRRQVVMALAWCGGRKAIGPLMNALNDKDWVTRQAAQVALTNLTGMEFDFDALASPERRKEQIGVWRSWWATVPADRPPKDVLDLLAGPRNLAAGCAVSASTTYKGPPEVLTDGDFGPAYWQTKNVKPPQGLTAEDLGRCNELFIGTKGFLGTSGRGEGVRLVPEAKMRGYQKPAPVLERVRGHHQDWIQACKGGRPACSNFSIAGPYAEWMLLGAICWRLPNEKLLWDGKNLRFTNNEKANEFVKPHFRKGWELKDVAL